MKLKICEVEVAGRLETGEHPEDFDWHSSAVADDLVMFADSKEGDIEPVLFGCLPMGCWPSMQITVWSTSLVQSW